MDVQWQEIENKLNSIVTDLNNIRGGYASVGAIVQTTGLSIGSGKKGPASTDFVYFIAGYSYDKSAITAGTALSGSNLPNGSKYGAWALDINAGGTISIVAASGNATGYATSALALAGLATVATDKARMGTVVILNDSAGAFVPGTTDLDTAGLTVTYADGVSLFASLPALQSQLGT